MSHILRKMDDDFGIIPNPKYDESQETHYPEISSAAPLAAVPLSVSDAERAAVVLSALSCKSWLDVVPVYFEQTVSSKQLRDADSIEMLNLIKKERYFEPCCVFPNAKNALNSILNGFKVHPITVNAASAVAANSEALGKAYK